ncbi:hypothetical protein [Nocardioides koreensis]|uniref:hypothetical protein n=1 Tax=Nocardioides koreensis TaxID=433651 RepID=UPI0031E07903
MELQTLEHEGKTDPQPIRLTADRADWEAGEPLRPTIDWSQARPIDVTHAKLLTSEVVQHLRAALDYLAYNLVWLDAGPPDRGRERSIHFPVVRQETRWKAEATGRLPGVTPEHLAIIREYQPFAGCSWTATLADLAMIDRHRFVLDVFREYSGAFSNSPETVSIDPDNPTRVVVDVGGLDFRFLLPDERPAVEALATLSREAAMLVWRMQGDFGEYDELTIPRQ